jgi:hypothetical protein
VTSREFASWPELHTAQQNARTLQGKYQDAAAALDEANRRLARIAGRHLDDGDGWCARCSYDNVRRVPFPCIDHLDATGATS